MTPIPVYITDCVQDCMVIAHQAETLARDAFALAERATVVGAVGIALMLLCLGAIAMTTAFRK